MVEGGYFRVWSQAAMTDLPPREGTLLTEAELAARESWLVDLLGLLDPPAALADLLALEVLTGTRRLMLRRGAAPPAPAHADQAWTRLTAPLPAVADCSTYHFTVVLDGRRPETAPRLMNSLLLAIMTAPGVGVPAWLRLRTARWRIAFRFAAPGDRR